MQKQSLFAIRADWFYLYIDVAAKFKDDICRMIAVGIVYKRVFSTLTAFRCTKSDLVEFQYQRYKLIVNFSIPQSGMFMNVDG